MFILQQSTCRQPSNHMNLIQQFANFIREHHLQDVIEKQFALSTKDKLPLNREFLQERLMHFMQAIEEGNEIAYAKQRLQLLKEGAIKDIDEASVSLVFFHNIITSQKLALFEFVPCFAKDQATIMEVIAALENIYAKVTVLLMQFFEERNQTYFSRLQTTEEQYKDLFDNAHDLIQILHRDGIIQYVNNAWLHSLEYTLDEIKGRSIFQFIDETERERYLQYREGILLGKEHDKEIIFAFRTKSGKKLMVEGFVSPRYENGIAVSTRGIFRDVTERIKNEEELRFYVKQLAEREENLNNLITHAPDAIIVADAAGTITFWNPKAEDFFGWTSNDAIGRKLEETIIPPVYKQAHNAGMKRYIATGESHILNQTIEITALHRSGKEFPISLTISQSQHGGETVFISFSRDLTQQKKAELELLRRQKELEQSNRELEQYAWLTSHDLREPLRKVLTFSDMILTRHQDGLKDDIKNYLAKIHDAGKRMGKLIDAILQYSSLTENKDLLEPVNLNQVIQQVLADLEVSIKEAGADVQVAPLPVVEAIPIQMKQLLQNLVSNAIKYRSKERKAIICISSHNKNPNTVELVIRDNGIGFSMQDEKKIFSLFTRLTNEKETKGTGVGLALCRKIVLNHSGSISVQSSLGEGSTFYVSLPIKQQY